LKKATFFLIIAAILFSLLVSCGKGTDSNLDKPASKDSVEEEPTTDKDIPQNSNENADKSYTAGNPTVGKGQSEIVESTQTDLDGDNEEEEIDILQYKSNEQVNNEIEELEGVIRIKYVEKGKLRVLNEQYDFEGVIDLSNSNNFSQDNEESNMQYERSWVDVEYFQNDVRRINHALYEDGMDIKKVKAIKEKYFKTNTGSRFLASMYIMHTAGDFHS